MSLFKSQTFIRYPRVKILRSSGPLVRSQSDGKALKAITNKPSLRLPLRHPLRAYGQECLRCCRPLLQCGAGSAQANKVRPDGFWVWGFSICTGICGWLGSCTHICAIDLPTQAPAGRHLSEAPQMSLFNSQLHIDHPFCYPQAKSLTGDGLLRVPRKLSHHRHQRACCGLHLSWVSAWRPRPAAVVAEALQRLDVLLPGGARQVVPARKSRRNICYVCMWC